MEHFGSGDQEYNGSHLMGLDGFVGSTYGPDFYQDG